MNTYTKKIFGFAVFIWVAGAFAYGWVHLDSKLQERKLEKNQQIITSKLDKLDRVIKGESNMNELSSAIPNDELEKSINEQFADSNEFKPYILSSAVISLSLGTFMFSVVGLLKLYKHFSQKFPMSDNFDSSANTKSRGKTQNRSNRSELADNDDQVMEKSPDKGTMKLSQYKDNKYDGPERRKGERRVADVKFKGPDRRKNDRRNSKAKLESEFLTSRSTYDFANINTLYCDADSLQNSKNPDGKKDDSEPSLIGQLEEKIRETITCGYNEQALKVDDSLKAQNEYLEKQIKELKEMAQTVRQKETENTDPDKNFTELAAQISAIREYAAQQHDRNEKLQEGYDWTIVRNFCLRFIRCIDNLENRIANAADEQAASLGEIKDELIFALESSGVEQYTPEINSDFNGQEKFAEVTREKVKAEKPEDKGKIAEVVKPGYHYVVDEENEKVVRTARVKLYE